MQTDCLGNFCKLAVRLKVVDDLCIALSASSFVAFEAASSFPVSASAVQALCDEGCKNNASLLNNLQIRIVTD